MAEHKKDIRQPSSTDSKIPVFTVLKNGTVLKNIFLITTPPLSDEIQEDAGGKKAHQDLEETLLIGRHPDCHIRLEHPSISRFHLRIYFKPSSKHLTVTDLSSVHGTWISGQMIEPKMRMELNEGDTLRIGGSSRLYRLHWIPLTQAYDFQNPFVPALDAPAPEEQKAKESNQVDNSISFRSEETQLVDSVPEGFDFLLPNPNSECSVQKEISSAPPMPEDVNCPVSIEENGEQVNKHEVVQSACWALEGLDSLFLDMNSEWSVQNKIQSESSIQEDTKILPSNESKGEEQVQEHKDKQSVDSVLMGLESLVPDVNSVWFEQKEIPTAAPVPEDTIFFVSNVQSGGEEQVTRNDVMQSVTEEDTQSMGSVLDGLEVVFLEDNSEWRQQLQGLQSDTNFMISHAETEGKEDIISEAEIVEELANQIPLREFKEQNIFSEILSEITMTEPIESLLPVGINFRTKTQQFVLRTTVQGSLLPVESNNQLFEEEQELFEFQVQGKNPRGPSLTPGLTERADGPTPCGKAKGGFAVNILQGNEESPPINEYEENGPWNFWSASVSSATLNPRGPSLTPSLTERADGSSPCGKAKGGLASPPRTGYEENDPWNFWSASVSNATLNLSPHSNEVLLESKKLMSRQSISERKCIDSPNVDVNQSSLRKNNEEEIWSFWSRTLGEETVCSSLSSDAEALSEPSTNEPVNNKNLNLMLLIPVEKARENLTLESTPIRSGEKFNLPSSWLRRGNPASDIQSQTRWSRGKKIVNEEDIIKYEPISRALFGEADYQRGEIFTPDKENCTPNTHTSMIKFGMLKEVEHSYSDRSPLKSIGNFDIHSEECTSASSDKKNRTPKVDRPRKSVRRSPSNNAKNRRERMPFQLLLANSFQKSISETCISNAAENSHNYVNYEEAPNNNNKSSSEGTQRWNMIVDTTCLLNKKSRKALKLLEGLKGTKLIIPRIVMRELNCMKRQIHLFGRKTEVSSALDLIEECMVKTKWWIHMQSSVEEERLIAPTPPASPQSQLSSKIRDAILSSFGTLPEIASPTAEDHILDYTILFQRFQNDGHLVLLTNNISMKIKAMAEGLICETAEEFRASLVNPFSERFMWADSSPRGQTWSCLDDIVLRENFYPSSLKMTDKVESIKGLKLLLHHNFHHAKISLIR
ncbi:hypothetical protein Nepgr_002153 [Nepenthes gracilis]|uniref:FHA domain-containing protein n=1 Tax=Nepenthes gracilis TaxID=150966 RepID=A0AAD3P5Q0_NEPGR|nr:hypothetical protein Nepgr_002153 [Nepenthes gracilis]